MARSIFAIYLCAFLSCSFISNAVAADGPKDERAANVEALRHKLERIVLPKLDLREATLREALKFLKKKSVENDVESTEDPRGVNFVLKLNDDAKVADEARITVSLTNIPLMDALKYVTGLANVKYKIEPYAVSIVPIVENARELITKEWKIPKDLIPGFPQAGEGKVADREMAKNWLIANGVVFNNTASAIYVVKSSRLIVRNTQDQLDLVDTILAVETSPPALVEIASYLVEIEQSSLEKLKLDPLGMFSTPPAKNVFISGGTVGVATDPSSAFIAESFEKLLFPDRANDATLAGGELAGVLTDPQFQLFLRMLNQIQGVTIFSAPKLTVASGGHAVIEAFRDFHDFDLEVPPQVRAIAGSSHVTKPAEKGGTSEFADRHYGVTLEVMPVVGPDGYTVDVEITPQAVEFEGGLPPRDPRFKGPLLFGTRKSATTVSVYDGSTVVLGDLLRAGVPQFAEKKELLLGKTALLGRFAEEELEKPGKRVLMLFVSVRKINPGSEPVRADDEKKEVIEQPARVPEKAK